MKTQSIGFTKILGAVTMGAFISLGIFYSAQSSAAQGCGHGYHMTGYGRCVPNAPGPYATGIPGRPDCWRNRYGYVRCY